MFLTTFIIFLIVNILLLSFFCHGDDDNSSLNPNRLFITPRPTVYTGLQTSTKDPVYFAMMWNDHHLERGSFLHIREMANINDAPNVVNIKGNRCDGMNFCEIEIEDNLHTNLMITNQWIKPIDSNDSFAFRVEGKIGNDDGDINIFGESVISVYMYISVSSPLSRLEINEEQKEIKGYDPMYGGNFILKYDIDNDDNKEKRKNEDDGLYYYYGNYTKDKQFFVSDLVKNMLIYGIEEIDNPACCKPWNHDRYLPNKMFSDKSNVIVIQKVLKTPFRWTVQFENVEYPPNEYNFDNLLDYYKKEFDIKFDKTFPIFNYLKGTSNINIKKRELDIIDDFGKRILSSLLMGLSYFEGVSFFKNEFGKIIENENRKLFTFIPCKLGFPRGFYWDESFHEMVILRFNPKLNEKITSYWYNISSTMPQYSGWIAREQVIGHESLLTTPEWAWADSVFEMNPPSYYITQEMMFDVNRNIEYLRQIFPKYVNTAKWYLKNCKSNVEYTYKWNGRLGDGSFDSGLDDFPRKHTATKSEKHVDLQSWIAKTAQIMEKFSRIIGEKEYEIYFKNISVSVMGKLSSLFWSDKVGFYVDIDDNEFSDHVGVAGLLPFCLQLEQNETRIKRIISVLSDNSQLYSEFGIMSLSKKDKYYNDGNYWRGNIWLNQNYLCLRGLKYYEEKGYIEIKPIRKLIQKQIIDNMIKNYYCKNGNVFETYSPITGKGYNHSLFAGWSSLVLLIMSEDYR